MRKELLAMALTGVVLLCCACGEKNPDNPLPSDAGSEPVQTAGAAPQEIVDSSDSTADSRDAMLSAYYDILRGVCYDHVFPDGIDYGYFEPDSPSANQFAICDVDGDGQDELIVIYTSTSYMAGMVEKIYRFDPQTGEAKEIFSEFPMLTFYDNGFIQAEWSHRPGPAGDSLWPYTLWQYDPDTDGYTAVGMVDSWDQSWSGEEYNGQTFPADVDQDGDGVVYYVMDYGNYDLTNPVDYAQYAQWRDSFLGGAAEFTPPFEDLSEENVQ